MAYSSLGSRYTYHVFVSSRGTDTRTNFTDHLYAALINAGIITFRDAEGIPIGASITEELQKAIRESKISVVVFSRNYATSRWCLDELVRILDRRKTHGQTVFPVFYDVKPSDVENQGGSLAEAYFRHDAKMECMEKLEVWRKALREAARLEGMVLGYQDG